MKGVPLSGGAKTASLPHFVLHFSLSPMGTMDSEKAGVHHAKFPNY